MRFLIHGKLAKTALAALVKHEHAVHELAELPTEDAGAAAAGDAAVLMPLLEKQQWNLLTTETAFVRDVYDKKIAYSGVIVQVLDEITAAKAQVDAIERLFERYKRLTPRRLYTVTASRVKIRQLPGGHST